MIDVIKTITTNPVQATLRVSFGTGSQVPHHLECVLDTRFGGLNGGKIHFAPGDTVYFLIYADPLVTITNVATSAGYLFQTDPGLIALTETLFFRQGDPAKLAHPCLELLSISWHGNDLGYLALQPDRQTLRAEIPGTGVAQVSYFPIPPLAFGITTPPPDALSLVYYTICVVVEAISL